MPVTPVDATASSKPGSSDHRSRADDAIARLERYGIDADALDGAGRGALAAGDLRAFEGGAGRRGAGEQAVLRAEHDLGIGADIDDEHVVFGILRRFREHDAGRVGADMAGDAGQDIDIGAGIELEIELVGGPRDRQARWRARRVRRRARSDRCRGTDDA